jgi:hypothetical protein
MSALGQKQTCAAQKVMSALTPKAAILPYAQKGLAEQKYAGGPRSPKLR